MLRRPRTLTARLVAVAVLLVAFTALLIGTVTALAMRNHLTHELDLEVRESLERSTRGPGKLGEEGRPRGPGDFGPGQKFGTLTAVLSDSGTATGLVLAERDDDSWSASTALTDSQLATLGDLPEGRRVSTVDVPGLGDYRVAAASVDGAQVVAGLPLDEVDETIANLVRLELLATLIGVAAAAAAGLFVVRRQLRPLREVAATAHTVAGQPLAQGEIRLAARVPDRLTDEHTEVGQVGAALNTLLAHVETSLGARHRSEQQVRQFVADASHELRTPLATIKGYAELSRRTPEDASAMGAAMAKVETEAGRMSTLVDDLLLLARLDSGRPLAREDVDLTRLVLEAVADTRVLAPEHRWQLRLPDEPVSVIGDEQRLHQVVTNLLGNARKHTPEGTMVTVSVSAEPAQDPVWAVITVHDDGPGLKPDLTEQAFERFTRGDSSRTRASGGAGLGLSLVSAIAQAHDGHATVLSSPHDTTFTVTLPAAGPASASTEAQPDRT